MKKQKKMIGIGMAMSAIIAKKGGVKMEVVNSLARQCKTLQAQGFSSFIYLFQMHKYGHSRSVLEEMFSEAFWKWKIESFIVENGSTICEESAVAISRNFIPIVGGWMEDDECGLSGCNEQDRFFATLCRSLNADLVVFAGDYYACKHKREVYSMLLDQGNFVAITHHEADFLLKSVTIGRKYFSNISQARPFLNFVGLPHMFC